MKEKIERSFAIKEEALKAAETLTDDASASVLFLGSKSQAQTDSPAGRQPVCRSVDLLGS